MGGPDCNITVDHATSHVIVKLCFFMLWKKAWEFKRRKLVETKDTFTGIPLSSHTFGVFVLALISIFLKLHILSRKRQKRTFWSGHLAPFDRQHKPHIDSRFFTTKSFVLSLFHYFAFSPSTESLISHSDWELWKSSITIFKISMCIVKEQWRLDHLD